jgi:hypothetical protein
MQWLTEEPMPARMTAEMDAAVVLQIMSAGRSALTDNILSPYVLL